MKSFDRAFSKARGVLGQSPKSRPLTRNSFYGVLIRKAHYWFIFLRLLAQKRTETISST
jgi:hypothetical protein